jgi:hypothetical protein
MCRNQNTGKDSKERNKQNRDGTKEQRYIAKGEGIEKREREGGVRKEKGPMAKGVRGRIERSAVVHFTILIFSGCGSF